MADTPDLNITWYCLNDRHTRCHRRACQCQCHDEGGAGDRESREPDPLPTRVKRAPITEREREVLIRVSFGMSNEEIAEDLGIRPMTVRTHVANLLFGLDAKNRSHAVGIFYRTGLFTGRTT